MSGKWFNKILFILTAMFSISFANGATYIGTSHTAAVVRTHHVHKVRHFRVSATVVPGSLKANIQRILKPYGWTVAWDMPYDFKFVGRVTIHAVNIEAVLRALLMNYPLQAVFFQGNHVVEIRSRTL